MRALVRSTGLGLAIVCVACGGGDRAAERARADALAARVDQLEKRLAAAERGVEPLEQTRNQVASLDRRVSVVETSVHELAARPAAAPPPAGVPPQAGTPPAPTPPPAAGLGPGSGPGMWGGPTTRAMREGRRTQLRALSDEFRDRLARIRDESRGDPNADQQQKIQDTLEWYRTQRRAVLRGDQPPQQ